MSTRSSFPQMLALLAGLYSVSGWPVSAAPMQPNVVFVLTDDQRVAAVGYHGPFPPEPRYADSYDHVPIPCAQNAYRSGNSVKAARGVHPMIHRSISPRRPTLR